MHIPTLAVATGTNRRPTVYSERTERALWNINVYVYEIITYTSHCKTMHAEYGRRVDSAKVGTLWERLANGVERFYLLARID